MYLYDLITEIIHHSGLTLTSPVPVHVQAAGVCAWLAEITLGGSA